MADYTTEELQTIIRGLESKLGSGLAEIQFGDRSMRFTSAKDISESLTYFRGLLNTQTSIDTGARRSRIVRLYSSKGV